LLTGMTCLVVLSWLFFLHTFNFPEIPKNYHRLEKLGRLPEIPNFEAINAPEGEMAQPRELHNSFFNLTPDTKQKLNTTLLRVYIQQFRDTQLNRYVQGEFKVISARKLNKNDLFGEGVVVRARSQRRIEGRPDPIPDLLDIELILPGAPSWVLKDYKKGALFEVFKTPHFSTVLHVETIEREGDEPLTYLTTVPLVYENNWKTPAGKSFKLTPPEKLLIDNSLPILDIKGTTPQPNK